MRNTNGVVIFKTVDGWAMRFGIRTIKAKRMYTLILIARQLQMHIDSTKYVA